jgi:hypothetical protein
MSLTVIDCQTLYCLYERCRLQHSSLLTGPATSQPSRAVLQANAHKPPS